MADLEGFIQKAKLITYIRVFIEVCNWRNREQVHKIHNLIKVKKIGALIAKNLYDLSTHQIIEISIVLYNTDIVPKNEDKIVFYINNSID